MKETTIDVQTGKESSRNFTADEIAQSNQLQEIETLVQAKESVRINAKKSLIEKLGLTADEADLF
jgi:hypothetical protein